METKEVEAIEIDGVLHKKEDCVWSEWSQVWLPNEVAVEIYDGDHVHEDVRDNEFIWCVDTEDYHYRDDVWMCELSEEWFYHDDQQVSSWCDMVGHEESFEEDADWNYCRAGSADGYWVHYDESCYVEDEQCYVHTDDAYYCDEGECYYYHEENTNAIGEDCVQSYHSNKSPRNFNPDFAHSPFSIGFEVEKKCFEADNGSIASDRGEYVGSYDFFCGFETDSSCGVEGVSNILPLASPRSQFRKNVFKMIDEAQNVIDSKYDKTCGGHITVSVKDYNDGYDIVDKMRQTLALMYALYRYRLKRSYCNQNKPAKKENNAKYSPVNVKDRRVEFRLPSAVKNTKQLKLRYDLMYKMMYHSFTRRVSFEVFLQKVRHIVMKMYNGNEQKVDHIYNVAREFRHYLIAEDVGNLVDEFINEKREEE